MRIQGKNIAVLIGVPGKEKVVGLSTSCSIDLQTDMIEMASISDVFRGYTPGRHSMSIQIDRLYDTANTLPMFALQISRTRLKYVVDVKGTTVTGEAYISHQSASAPVDGYATHNVTLTCSGEIVVDAGYIAFADAEVARICADSFGDGFGVTEGMAADVESIGVVFYKKTTIASFDELAMFTGIKVLSEHAFEGCSSLTSVRVPSSVVKLEGYSFAGTALKTFECEAVEVSYWVFSNNNSLANLSLPKAKILGQYSCYRCRTLSSVALGCVEDIKSDAFYECTSLRTIALPATLRLIGARAFMGSVLVSVTIPEGVTSIGDNAFKGCQHLITVRMLGTRPPTLGVDAFGPLVPSLPTIFVPEAALGAYRSATNWSVYANFLQGY